MGVLGKFEDFKLNLEQVCVEPIYNTVLYLITYLYFFQHVSFHNKEQRGVSYSKGPREGYCVGVLLKTSNQFLDDDDNDDHHNNTGLCKATE